MGTTQEPCRRWRELLSPHLEGELEPEEASALQEHLAGCPSCRRELLLLKETVDVLRRLPQEPPPPQIMEGVRREMARRRWWPQRLGDWHPLPSLPVLARVAAVLVVGVSIVFIHQRYPFLQRESTRLKAPAPQRVELPRSTLPPVLTEQAPAERLPVAEAPGPAPAPTPAAPRAPAASGTPAAPAPGPSPAVPSEPPVDRRSGAPPIGPPTVTTTMPSTGKPSREQPQVLTESDEPRPRREKSNATQDKPAPEQAAPVAKRDLDHEKPALPLPRKDESRMQKGEPELPFASRPAGEPRVAAESAKSLAVRDEASGKTVAPAAPGGLLGIVRELREAPPTGASETAGVREKSVRRILERAREEKEPSYRLEAGPALVLFVSAPEGFDIRSSVTARLARLGGRIESTTPLSGATRRRFLDVVADSRLRQDEDGITVNVLLPAGADAGRVLLADTPLELLLREEGPGAGTVHDGLQLVTLHVLGRR